MNIRLIHPDGTAAAIRARHVRGTIALGRVKPGHALELALGASTRTPRAVAAGLRRAIDGSRFRTAAVEVDETARLVRVVSTLAAPATEIA
jgi:hypothetical protein